MKQFKTTLIRVALALLTLSASMAMAGNGSVTGPFGG